MQPCCTTCGAWDFRRQIFQRAFDTAGFENGRYQWNNPRDVLSALSHSERKKIAAKITKGLKDIDDLRGLSEEGLRTVFIDLDELYELRDPDPTLDEILDGSEAGNYLAKMRAHSDALYAERSQRRLVEEENREKRKQKKSKQNPQTTPPRPQRERIAEGSGAVQEFLREYIELPPAEKLEILAKNEFLFPLDIIPRDQVPANADLTALTAEERKRLIHRIDKRTGRWKSLKTRLSSPSNEEDR